MGLLGAFVLGVFLTIVVVAIIMDKEEKKIYPKLEYCSTCDTMTEHSNGICNNHVKEKK